MLDAEWGQLGATPLIVNENVRFVYHVKEVLPVLGHVSLQLLG
jgi:hypothetical protein